MLLSVKNLIKHFGAVKAVDGVSFDVEKGEVFGFLGPNGAGKTTTIRCILDFIRPDGGEIDLLGHSNKKNGFNLSRHKVGYLISGINLVEHWSGKDHLNFQQSLRGKSNNLNSLLKRFDFNPSGKVKSLSTGNRQKLGLIMALMNNPEFLILDEPTAGLDPILQEEFYKIISDLKKDGVSIFMSSHNLPEVQKVCDRAAIIKAGKIITLKPISELSGHGTYEIKVIFVDKKISLQNLKVDKVSNLKKVGPGYNFQLGGSITEFLKIISKYEIENINITSANLEDVFLDYYK